MEINRERYGERGKPGMQTPIYDFLSRYRESGISRLHMPGHKGDLPFPALREISRLDITEIAGADALYEAEGIIGESEDNASALYGSRFTCYSAGGSTLGIQAMVAAVSSPGGSILAGRNAHMAFVNACALLDVQPIWMLPRYNDSFGVSGEMTPETVEEALKRYPQAGAVYLTSPDYLGCMSDVKGIADVCRRFHRPLLVDNAHGAHLRFLPRDRHPITLGAALCCDSAHKTLPVLTGGAYLHAGSSFPGDKAFLKSRMALFGSTSPSYLILLSLDLCNRYLEERGRADFAVLEQNAMQLQKAMEEKGFLPLCAHMDPTKLTFDAYAAGWRGEELAGWFRRQGIECEYAASRHVVLMLSPQNTRRDLHRILQSIRALALHTPLCAADGPFVLPETVMPLRQAMFASSERIPVEQARGRVAAETRIKCPPGVPVIVAGEEIGENTQKLLKKSSIATINVVK